MSRPSDIARYYDANTSRFLRFGGGARHLAIHRQLWAEGVTSVQAAANHLNVLLGERLADMHIDAPSIVDLGCGVGGTLFELGHRFPSAQLLGMTLSARQYEIAQATARRLRLDSRCRIELGDFETRRLEARADFVVAIESFAHARSRSAFFAHAAALCRDGGRVVVVDDFLSAAGSVASEDDARVIRDFRSGWRLPSLGTVAEAARAAEIHGLRVVDDRALTDLIRLDRPGPAAIRALAPWLRRLGLGGWPLFANMIGGGALQSGLLRGLFEYRWLEFAPR